MIRKLAGAFQMLTVIPMPGGPVHPGDAAVFYPLVGALIGAAGGLLFLLAGAIFPTGMAGWLTVGLWVLMTGALHEDGLADCADAIRKPRTRERMFEILKDSRIGAFGGLALVLSVGLRAQAVSSLPGNPVLWLVGVQALARLTILWLASWSRAAQEGSGAEFRERLSGPVLFAASLQGVLAAFLCGWLAGAVLVLAALGVTAVARVFFQKRLGGVTGDCLGAVEQVTEISLLVAATAFSGPVGFRGGYW